VLGGDEVEVVAALRLQVQGHRGDVLKLLAEVER